MRRRGQSNIWRNEVGAAAAVYALALPALVAVAGIGFDYARVASMDTELQNAADQATLAAATQLDKQAGSQARAIAAANNLVSNKTLFANDGEGGDVAIATVTFFENALDAEAGSNGFNNPGDATDDGRAAYVRVTVATRRANYALTPVVGAFYGELAAQAVAGVGSAVCRTPPLMMCNPSEPLGNADGGLDFNPNAHVGQGFIAKKGGGSQWTPGTYGWLETGLGSGANNVRKSIGWGTTPGNCLAQNGVDTIDTQPGNIANAPQAMNTRFDMYDTPGCEAGGTCPPSINSRKDVVRPDTGGACDWQQVASGGRYLPTSNAPYDQSISDAAWPIKSMGHPRDICHSTATASCSGGVFGDGNWDRDAYFRTHYVRSAATVYGGVGSRWKPADWQRELGLTSPTRYQVYLWEIQNRSANCSDPTTYVDGVGVLCPSSHSSGGTTLVNHGTPICSPTQTPSNGWGQIPSASTADRRRVSVAVINCYAHDVKGNTTGVPVRRWMDVFLVQPSVARDRTAHDEIYVEVIGETTAGSAGETAGTVIRRDMPYLLR